MKENKKAEFAQKVIDYIDNLDETLKFQEKRRVLSYAYKLFNKTHFDAKEKKEK